MSKDFEDSDDKVYWRSSEKAKFPIYISFEARLNNPQESQQSCSEGLVCECEPTIFPSCSRSPNEEIQVHLELVQS